MEIDVKDILLNLLIDEDDLSSDSDLLDSEEDSEDIIENIVMDDDEEFTNNQNEVKVMATLAPMVQSTPTVMPVSFIVEAPTYKFEQPEIKVELAPQKNSFWDEDVADFTDAKFIQEFRINKTLFRDLAKAFHDSKYYSPLRNKSRPAEKHLAVFFWFVGRQGCAFRDLKIRFNYSLSSIFSYIKRSWKFINEYLGEAIVWPNEDSKKITEQHFCENCKLRQIIGVIGLTKIKVYQPKGKKMVYSDRQCNANINLHVICNEKNKFTHVTIGVADPSENVTAFKSSQLYKELRQMCGENYLLGDLIYSCCETVITPYKEDIPLSEPQIIFNKAHLSAIAYLERAVYDLKTRFPQLYSCKLKGQENIFGFIKACCILHNVADSSDLRYLSENVVIEQTIIPDN